LLGQAAFMIAQRPAIGGADNVFAGSVVIVAVTKEQADGHVEQPGDFFQISN